MSVIGENIKRIRKSKKLSQEELSNRILDDNGQSISRVTITRYENGRDPSFDMLRKIADVLEVSVVELFGDNSAEAEEKVMIELLIERTMNSEMKWDIAESILNDAKGGKRKEEAESINRMILFYSKTTNILHLSMSEVYYSVYDNIEYLLITHTTSYADTGTRINKRMRSLLVDAHENDVIFTFEKNLEDSLSRLFDNIKDSKSTAHKKDINKIIESLSKTKNNKK